MDIFKSILEKAELTGDNLPDCEETDDEDCRNFSIPEILRTPEMERVLLSQNMVPSRDGYFNLDFCEITSDSFKEDDFSWSGRVLENTVEILSLSRMNGEIIISVNTQTLPDSGIPFSSEQFILEIKMTSFTDFKIHQLKWSGNFTGFKLAFVPPAGHYLLRVTLYGFIENSVCMVKTTNRLETEPLFR